jgi:YidC/Oxa1 family membrane protein insertase
MRNPEDADVERRLLLAILLSMAILFATPYVYQFFFPAPLPPVAGTTVVEEPPAPTAAARMAEAGDSAAKASVPETGMDTVAEPVLVRLENEDLELAVDSRGGILESARLKKFLDEEGQPLELIPQRLPAEFDRLLDVRTGNEVLDGRLRDAVYAVETEQDPGGGGEVRLHYRRGALEVSKQLVLPRAGYVLEVKLAGRSDEQSLPLGLSLGTGVGRLPGGTAGDFALAQVVFLQAGRVERYDAGDLEAGAVQIEGDLRWLALDSKYFAATAVAGGLIRSARLERREWSHQSAAGKPEVLPLVAASVGLRPDATVRLFLGPKQSAELEAVDASLTELIDYGWFAVLVVPLLAALKAIYAFVGNYGWAIILLTFGINLVLFPVRYKQIVSMQKMSALQPKLRSIQDRYKRMKRDDPRRQQMNAEVMALYKEHGVNPLGGCLPLLLQMPILFAFYRMLDMSIELRGAPFIWWITDLSKHDPYFITPIVMGATMVAQQKMTPATGDPAQRKMMMFLPVVFTFFFLWVSSGLAIYFLFSNVFAMLFQAVLQRLRPELVPGAAGAARRAKA